MVMEKIQRERIQENVQQILYIAAEMLFITKQMDRILLNRRSPWYFYGLFERPGKFRELEEKFEADHIKIKKFNIFEEFKKS
jgi:hypothetical protein